MITIKKFVFNTFMVNSYLLSDETGEALLIDAACYGKDEEEELSGYLASNHLKLVRNLNTHCHIDHILGNGYIAATYGMGPEYHAASVPFFHTAQEIGYSFGFVLDDIPEPRGLLRDGEIVRWGNSELKVFYTPGHAEGSVCLY
ncbi:MAG TPA: MBL fold metallo-hydrolase, partial [Bacteroidales bacterium]|nr:MBL fold metallo-hydrolase [Bacteroidales bacterium]